MSFAKMHLKRNNKNFGKKLQLKSKNIKKIMKKYIYQHMD